jgi:hypothetical protein
MVPGPACALPLQVLGLPLLVYALKKGDLLPLVDAVADRLPSWQANLMNKAGRTTLTKVMLSVVPIHISIAIEISQWILHAIDKIRRSFVWTGSDSTPGGRCMVA